MNKSNIMAVELTKLMNRTCSEFLNNRIENENINIGEIVTCILNSYSNSMVGMLKNIAKSTPETSEIIMELSDSIMKSFQENKSIKKNFHVHDLNSQKSQ